MAITAEQKKQYALRKALKYRNDPKYREKSLERSRKWREAHRDPNKPPRIKKTAEEIKLREQEYRQRPEVKKRRNARLYERYHNDEEYREKIKKRALIRYYNTRKNDGKTY